VLVQTYVREENAAEKETTDQCGVMAVTKSRDFCHSREERRSVD
jgi:hypothetical protein